MPKNEKSYYYDSYTVKARFYRTWTRWGFTFRWKYRQEVKTFNNKQTLPIQKIIDISAYFLLTRFFSRRILLTPPSPFPKFNRWLRTILFFFRPTRIIKTFKRNFNTEFILLLNFKRWRFFPSIRSIYKPSFVSLSLGLFRRFTRRSRAWTKTRMSYLLVASFLRKVLMYTTFRAMYLFVNRAPRHLNSILHTLQAPAPQIYEYPFLNFKLNQQKNRFSYRNGEVQFTTPDSDAPLKLPIMEEFRPYQIQFPYIVFTNAKAYAPTRKKKTWKFETSTF